MSDSSAPRVLIVGPTRKFGGKANFTGTVFRSLTKEGFSVGLFEASRSTIPKSAVDDGGTRMRIRMSSGRRLVRVGISIAVQKLRFVTTMVLGRFHAAQIHVSSYFDFYDLSVLVLASKLLRRKAIIRCGGGTFDHFYLEGSRLRRWYISWVLRSADRVIAQSGYWKEFISGIGVDPQRIHIVPNFVDVAYWSEAGDEVSGHGSDVTAVFMPGGSEHRKGYHTFMPAFARVAARHPHLKLRLIALGREIEDEYRFLVDRGRIEVHGFLSGEEKRVAIQSGDIFALPTHGEGFPNALIEAMAAGLAVITSDIPQITSIVEEETNALLVDPANSTEIEHAIERLVQDVELRRSMGRNNVARCREFYDTNLIPTYFSALYSFMVRGAGAAEPSSRS